MLIQPFGTARRPIIMPREFQDLWTPARHKAFHGGRGGGKSHSMCGALIEMGFERRLRVGCYREIQKSISSSVKKLLDDKIDAAGLGARGNGFYTSTQYGIHAPNGTEFLFAGLRTNPDNVKSTEGLDIAFVEEANSVSNSSLGLLTPTLRKDGSELWYGWNRRSVKDPVDNMFLGGKPPPRSIVKQVNWRDNPWFPDVLREEMEWDKARDFDKYLHVWEGEPITRSEARVFQNWRVEDIDDEIPDGCIARLGADWGFSIDPTVLIVCYVFGRTLYFRREAWALKCDIDHTPALFKGDCPHEKGHPLRWENPIDKNFAGLPEARNGGKIVADSANPQTISYMKRKGFNIVASKKGPGSIEEGVEFMKSYDIVVHPDCPHVKDELEHYSYKTDPLTDEVLADLADKKNHTIDACRYALENVRRALGGRIGIFGGETIVIKE